MSSFIFLDRLLGPVISKMRILLVNVDAKWNLAIRKLYKFYMGNNDVEMRDLNFSSYPHKKEVTIDASGYDKVYVSNIFQQNKDRVKVVNCEYVDYGGVGSNFPLKKLPSNIDNLEPYYYPNEDTAHGFITRGCIRNCYFCLVPKTEGSLRYYRDVATVVGDKKKAIFMDNNILAYEGCNDILRWLIVHKIKCEFNQGLDIRLINDENARLLSMLKYSGEYFFAFDNPADKPVIEEQLKIVKRWIDKDWKLKFFLYFQPKMKVKDLIMRVEWCRKNYCLPYVMRDKECWNADIHLKNFLIDYSAYCNQPAFFKNMSFDEFIYFERHANKTPDNERVINTIRIFDENL